MPVFSGGVASLYKINSLVMVLPADRFIQVMDKDGRLAREVMGAMALKIRRLYRQLKNTTNAPSGEKRLAAKLFKLGKDYGVCSGDGTLIEMNSSILLRPKQALR